MWPYFAVFAPIAFMSTITQPRRIYPVFWSLMFVVIVIFVGLRHHVGMDWNNYLIMIRRANIGEWTESFNVAEPGYATLLWVSGQLDWGVYGTYLAGTLIFAAGLFRYARTTPYPWIALTVAMPFLVIVVAMSAARQAVAIGVLLWLAAVWQRSGLGWRVALILLATSFHTSAAVFLIFAVLDLRVRAWIKVIAIAVAGALLTYIMITTGRADYYDNVYATGQTELTQSSGAIFHTLLNGGPALLAFALGRRFRNILLPDRFHVNMAFASIVLVLLVPFASAAAGRLTLYLFPVSMMIFSSLPLIVESAGSRSMLRQVTAALMLLLLTVWLNFGNAAIAHRVYSNALFVDPYLLVLCCR
ncbi:MAG: EpsG family protein [Paracoccaceae bacterium]